MDFCVREKDHLVKADVSLRAFVLADGEGEKGASKVTVLFHGDWPLASGVFWEIASNYCVGEVQTEVRRCSAADAAH